MRSLRALMLTAAITATLATACTPEKSAPEAAAPSPAASAALAPAPANDDAALASAVDTFIHGMFEHSPVFAAGAGKHEYDGKLPDYSPEGLKATASWLHAQRDAFAAYADDRLDRTVASSATTCWR